MGGIEHKSIAGHDGEVEPLRARLQVDERRAQLLELGLRLFSEHAYDEVSIDDIAREAGVSKGLLYHYFGGKRDFYIECVRNAAELLVERTYQDDSLPEEDRARAGLEAYLDFVEQRASSYGALMRSGIGNDPEVASVVERTRTEIVDRMLKTMGIDPPRPIVRAACRSWVGQVEAASLDWLDRRDVSRQGLVTILLGGLYGTLSMAKALDPDAPFVLPPPPPGIF